MSATYSVLPAISIRVGVLNAAFDEPRLPNDCRNTPAGEYSTRRFQVVSATQMRPAKSTARPCGVCSDPKLSITAPVVAFSSTTRLWLLSATYTVLPTTVTSLGELSRPAGVVHVVVIVAVFQRWTRLLNVSATIRSAPAEAIANGQCSWSAPVPALPPFFPVGTPAAVNWSSRLFLVSATHSVFVAV